MKKATRCYECKKMVRDADTYWIKLEEDQIVNGITVKANDETIRKFCPICTFEAGYIVNREKLRRYGYDKFNLSTKEVK